jgi:hypothetical protein
MKMVMMLSDYLFYSSTAMIIAGVATFLGCSYLAAPYGKYTSSKGWGVLLNPKYAWIIMESPNIWIAYLVYVYRPSSSDEISSNAHNQILLGCFILHYINRSIIYPLRMESNSSAPMPITVSILSIIIYQHLLRVDDLPFFIIVPIVCMTIYAGNVC